MHTKMLSLKAAVHIKGIRGVAILKGSTPTANLFCELPNGLPVDFTQLLQLRIKRPWRGMHSIFKFVLDRETQKYR